MYLPEMPQEEIDKAVRWEAKEKLLVEEESYIIDYVVLGEVKSAQQAQKEILFFSVPKKEIMDSYGLVSTLGLRIAAIRPGFLAAFQGLDNKSVWGENEVAGFLDIGAGSTQFSIISEGYVRFNRRFNISGDSITRSLADYCRVSYEEAERDKRSIGMSRMALEEDRKDGGVSTQPLVRISHAVGLHLDQLITEIQHTFNYYALQISSSPISKIDRLIITGGGASMKGIAEFFKNRLNIPVDVPNPLSYIKSGMEGQAITRYLDSGPRFSAAIGLAQRQ
jgi:type IV pilus assembly protein PilM